MEQDSLTDREHQVLESVVRNYIISAEPTGSRFVARRSMPGLSSATIRNVMYDLEEKGFVRQPHTSAGRVPTDKGYRYYVDRMMERTELPAEVKTEISETIGAVDPTDLHLLMEATARALSRVTDQLGMTLAPRLTRGLFRHIHIFEMEPHRYMVHLTIDSGFVKTMTVELESPVGAQRLEAACQTINERFRDLRLSDMAEREGEIFSDVEAYHLGIIRLFIPCVKKLLRDEEDEIFTQGETNIVRKPEFVQPELMGAVIEILGEKRLLMHLLDTEDSAPGRVIISIGGENKNGIFESFSVLKARYQVGNLEGTLGILGPKRMQYPFLLSAVDYTVKLLADFNK